MYVHSPSTVSRHPLTTLLAPADANEDLLTRNPNHTEGAWPAEDVEEEEKEDEDDAQAGAGARLGKTTEEDAEMDDVEALMADMAIEETDKVSPSPSHSRSKSADIYEI